mmetsp:Transcript_68266/g.197867  ORF Transcript_68266/g.197867 Transcript_68266/m.197867 type:complete len:436 (-) Transcript_68266:539-1846(-)
MVQLNSPERGTRNLILHFSVRPVPCTISAVTKRRAPVSYTNTHHSSNFGLENLGACTGPTASSSAKLVRVKVTYMVARSPSAMLSSSSTSTLHVTSMRGACRQNASTSSRWLSVKPNRSINLLSASPSPETTSLRVGQGAPPFAFGSCVTCGICNKGSQSSSCAWMRHRWNWMRPFTVSKAPDLSPDPFAAMATIDRTMSGEAVNICASSPMMMGSMCACNRPMCAHKIAVPLLIGGSLKGQCARGSIENNDDAGMSSIVVWSGPVGGPLAGNTSTCQTRSETFRRNTPLRPLRAALAPQALRIWAKAPTPKGTGLAATMASINRFMSPPPCAPANKPHRRASVDAAKMPGPSSARTSSSMTAWKMRNDSFDTPLAASLFVSLKQQQTTASGAPMITEKKQQRNVSRLPLVFTIAGWSAMPTFICDGPSGLPYFS